MITDRKWPVDTDRQTHSHIPALEMLLHLKTAVGAEMAPPRGE